MNKLPSLPSHRKLPRKKLFSTISSVIGVIIGVSATVKGILFVEGVYGNSLSNVGYWRIFYGLMIVLGSLLVYTRRIVLIGAVLILVPSFLVVPEGLALYTSYDAALTLGWILPIVSFVLAILSREPQAQKTPAGTVKSGES